MIVRDPVVKKPWRAGIHLSYSKTICSGWQESLPHQWRCSIHGTVMAETAWREPKADNGCQILAHMSALPQHLHLHDEIHVLFPSVSISHNPTKFIHSRSRCATSGEFGVGIDDWEVNGIEWKLQWLTQTKQKQEHDVQGAAAPSSEENNKI